MRINNFNIFLTGCLALCLFTGVPLSSSASSPLALFTKDTIPERQVLYNGRLWRNLHSQVKGDQFLFSREFTPGTVTMNGNTFKNVSLRYDILNDEVLTPVSRSLAIQLNRELVDSFSMSYQGRQYRFARFSDDSLKGVKGYLHVLYSGRCALYVKYKKEIELLAVDGKYDQFFQIQKIYFVNDGEIFTVTGKMDLLRIMDDKKSLIKDYIKKSRLKMSKNNPESFTPLVRFYDGLVK